MTLLLGKLRQSMSKILNRPSVSEHDEQALQARPAQPLQASHSKSSIDGSAR